MKTLSFTSLKFWANIKTPSWVAYARNPIEFRYVDAFEFSFMLSVFLCLWYVGESNPHLLQAYLRELVPVEDDFFPSLVVPYCNLPEVDPYLNGLFQAVGFFDNVEVHKPLIDPVPEAFSG